MAKSLKDTLKWSHIDGPKNPDFDKFTFASRRSVVWGTKGMVASTQPFANEAGLEILRKGGNAADAAVAVAAALNVTEPCNCGIGGDIFVLYWNEKEKSLKGLNGSGRSPAALSLEKARELGIKGREIPLSSPHSVTVPGAPAGFVDTVSHFGSGKVSLSEILDPAIRLAEGGFPVAELASGYWVKSENLLKKASPNGEEMLCEGGKAPLPGQIFRNPNLAKVFRALGKEGKKGYYEGPVAEAIVEVLKSQGGLMELSDLAAHESELVTPISYTYHDSFTLHECPPNGQGLTPLLALGIIEQMQELGLVDLEKVEYMGKEYCHAVIEALRLAFADTRAFIADMQHGDVPVEQLLNKEYLRSRAKLFNPEKATADVRKGSPLASSDTVYLTTADAEGNACSFIFSNYAGFGTGIVPKGCGFTLQNRGAGFTLEDGHPNCLAPKKRPYHTIIPAMVTRNNELFMAYGVMGGFMQPQGHLQVMLNMLHQGFHPQNALDAPRLCISAGMPDASTENTGAGDINSEVYFEEGVDPAVVEALGKMGHEVGMMSGSGRGMFGRGQIIQRKSDPVTGQLVWAAGSDPRGDGHATAQL